ncbi:MAG: PAS domain-containing protein [Rhodopseudomonas sp.]|nr:PAS domain-containing protein [Rhodopseudomonas sp.]
MSGTEYQLSWLADQRLADHALSPSPVWLWRADGSQILWANPQAASIFDSRSAKALSQRTFEAKHPSASQIARLAETLPETGASRLERLRGFGAALGGTLTCLCARIALPDGGLAVLVVATERAGKDVTMSERARRLLADIDRPAAVFTADGNLIEAKPEARALFGDKVDLAALGADRLAHSRAEPIAGPITMARFGDGSTLLVAVETNMTARANTAPGPRAHPADAAATAALERRVPLRFVWQMDETTRLSHGLDSFASVVGPQTAATPHQSWADLAERLALDPKGIITRALAARETWSGIAVSWPVDDSADRVAIEMSGLPVFDRERRFMGYRGFAICRDLDRLAARQSQSATAAAPAPASTPPVTPVVATPQVEPATPEPEATSPAMTPAATTPDAPPSPVQAVPPQAVPTPAAPPQITPPPQAAPADNVLAFRPPSPPAVATPAPAPAAPAPATPPSPPPTPSWTAGEHSAFEELARELNARLRGEPGRRPAAVPTVSDPDIAPAPDALVPPPAIATPQTASATMAYDGRPILDRLPIGVLVYRLNNLIYANSAFLKWTGYDTLQALDDAGGLDSLFIEPSQTTAASDAEDGKSPEKSCVGKTLTIATVKGAQKPVEGRLFSVPWAQDTALVLMINTQGMSDDRIKAIEAALRRTESENTELRAILDTATDGVLVLDRDGRVLSANRSAEALFGYDAADFTELSIGELFAAESRRGVLDYLDRLAGRDGHRLLDAGREAIGRVRQGGLVPLYITMGRIEDGDKFCAVMRDVTAWKRTEEELINARQQAERASTAKSEFLAKISHEIRTPLNAIIGFSEVMIDERFGAIGNDRYKQYLKDIHSSGGHLISLLNDLLDLSKIEAGKLDLSFVSVNLNDIVQQCVAIMQEQANRERVIIRTALPGTLPPIVADARSVRQIALNLLSNSIKFTGAGGQVIVSTALNDDNEAVLRVRDTGIGMSEAELQTALEPFRQMATSSRWGASGTGLGLPITKALAEANHARFRITSQPEDGTLVEVAFPATRVLAE